MDVTWVGPYMVVDAHARQSFTVQHLITKKRRRVHASRLKFYHDEAYMSLRSGLVMSHDKMNR